jgi:hypothetical protein
MAENGPKMALLCDLDARSSFFVLMRWTFIRVMDRRERAPFFAVFTPVFAPKLPITKAPQNPVFRSFCNFMHNRTF